MNLLRRYSPLRNKTPMRPSRGTVIASHVRNYVKARDNGHCIGKLLGFPGECWGALELDHVRPSGGLGMKSESTARNLASMCSVHHRYRTEHGKLTRPAVLAYLERVEPA